MKFDKLRCLLLVAFLVIFAVPAGAKPPELSLNSNGFASDTRPGTPLALSLTYKQAAGDAVKDARMVIDSPSGHTVVQASKSGSDPVAGVELTFNFTPQNSETYKYHVEVTSATGDSARFPETAGTELQFTCVSLWIKVATLVGGILVCLGLIPFVVYIAARSVNRRGDPSSAARLALFMGALLSYALFLYLFFGVYGMLGTGIGAVVLLAVLILLFSRRPAHH